MLYTLSRLFGIVTIAILLIQCGSSRTKGDPGGFEGSYRIGGTEAIVFPIYEAYEIEFQMFGDPILFFFKEKNAEGNLVYISDDENFSFVMAPGNLKGTFYEINEPPLEVIRE